MIDPSCSILLVDDDPNDRLLAIREMRKAFPNLEATEVASQRDFDVVMDNGEFDLVITDYRLRWTDGLSVLDTIKKRDPTCPVIMLTGTGSEEVAVQAMKTGLDDYVLKSPKHVARLPAAADAALHRARERRTIGELERRYSELFDGVPVGLYQTAPSGDILDANPALVRLLGYPDRDTLLATNILEVYADPADRLRWLHLLDRRETVTNFEVRMRRFDGSTCWVENSGQAARDADGTPLHYDGILQDVTERKQAEEALRESEESFRSLAAGANDAIVIADAGTGVILYANERYAEMTGYTNDELCGMDVLNLAPRGEATRAGQMRQARAAGTAAPDRYETTLLRKDGAHVPVETTIAQLVWQGQPALTGIIRNISERKRLDQHKSDLISMVSHELRSPLAVVLGYATVIERAGDDEDSRGKSVEAARKIHERCNTMAQLVENLLDVSRIQSGTFSLSLDSVDIGELAKTAAESVPATTGHSLETKIERRLPAVVCDPRRLSMAITNLVSNAVKFSPEGGTITVEARTKGKRVRISVADEGIGIAPRDRARIFDRFTQLDMSVTRAYAGVGMGLYVTRSIVEAHGGSITVESEPGKGSTFTMDLPIDQ